MARVIERWLVLAARDFKDDLIALVEEAGGTVLNVGGREYHTLATPNPRRRGVAVPDAVVLHEHAGQAKFLHAGYWRGLGRHVVFVCRPTGSSKGDTNRAARATGMYSVLDLAAFRSHLREYLKLGSRCRER